MYQQLALDCPHHLLLPLTATPSLASRHGPYQGILSPPAHHIYKQSLQDQIRLLLEGRPFEELHEHCDFSLAEQNEAAASKGVQSGAPSDFVPVVKKSVCYIVAAVIFNEKNEV